MCTWLAGRGAGLDGILWLDIVVDKAVACWQGCWVGWDIVVGYSG